MQRLNFDRDWQIHAGSTSNNWNQGKETESVDLPHDISISQHRDPNTPAGASNAFYPGCVAVYEKTFFVPQEWAGQSILLEFEGIYMNAVVRLNNQIIGHQPYGYSSFHCSLNRYLRPGSENQIRVTVNNGAVPNTRWYSGSGIYRHVWLLIGEQVHIAPWGVFVTTPEVSKVSTKIKVQTTLENNDQVPVMAKVRSKLTDSKGMSVTEVDSEIVLGIHEDNTCTQELNLTSARLWSPEDPYLYSLSSEVYRDGKLIDSQLTRIGIRSIIVDRQNGFQLNGQTRKMKGGCVHHDCGLLGAAAYDRAEERKIELLKQSGFDAVRCAHNPPSPAFLDACDRLGMLVIDEAFDCWREGKNPHDYSNYFENWWQRDISAMILRDRNHPSIIMWSTGNEIVERDGRSEGYSYARELADFIRQLDVSRPVTNALCGIHADPLISGLAANAAAQEKDDIWGRLSRDFIAPLDVAGYNYLLDRYQSDGAAFPDRIICGLETFPKDAFDYWQAVQKLPYVIGDFVWTSLDYLGEAGIGHVWHYGETNTLGKFPWRHANCGDLDLCGFKRPQSYYRDCVWGIAGQPFIAVYDPAFYGQPADISRWGWADVQASWTWPEFTGKPVAIDVYCHTSEVELLLNGVSLGRKPCGLKHRYLASFEARYQAGELVAVAYENDCPVSQTVLRTAGTAAVVQLSADRSLLRPEFGDLSYITIELLDSTQQRLDQSADTIKLTVEGNGVLLAAGNSDPCSEEPYTSSQCKLYQGRALAVLRASGEAGEITLTAAANDLPPVSISVEVN